MSTPKSIIFKAGITEGEIALKICRQFGLPRQTHVGNFDIGDTTVYAEFDPQNSGWYLPKLKEIITEVVGPDWVSVYLDFSRGDGGIVGFLTHKLGGLDSDVIYAQLPKDYGLYDNYPNEHNPYANPAVLDSIVQAIRAKVEELEDARRQRTPKKRRKRPHSEE